MPNAFIFKNRERIVAQAARYQIPTVYPLVMFVKAGGLLSYGVDAVDGYRRAPSYVDRILKGDKPANLPVQEPIKFELVSQSQDRQGARPHCADDTTHHRR